MLSEATWDHILVIVDVQLRIRVGRPRSLECDSNERLAKDVVEDRGAQRSILVQDFVADIPLIRCLANAGPKLGEFDVQL